MLEAAHAALRDMGESASQSAFALPLTLPDDLFQGPWSWS
jgi:hypothetical protein